MKDQGMILLTGYVGITSFLLGYGYKSLAVDEAALQWEVLLTGLAAILAGYLAIHAASTSQRSKETKEAIRFSGKVRRTVKGSIRGINNLVRTLNMSDVAPEDLHKIVKLTREIAPEPNEFTPIDLQLSYDQLDVMLNQANDYRRLDFSTETEAISEANQLLIHIAASLKDLDAKASKWYGRAFEEMGMKSN
ncbi:hypothetical protein [Thalassospira lucentensis]|uniref:hypothetical protein n=1 Tax=Thalassospira lucentensis TaxID=168935 RepID=UPI003D29F436|tara:strand:- start:215 stop:790 length:576 start_codon:yes stop_codon:yes gene_type:complete